MSVKESRLSDYGYHMVTAVSESAVNAQFKDYLHNAKDSVHIYYLDDGTANHNYFKVAVDTDDHKLPPSYDDALKAKIDELHKTGSSLFKEFEKQRVFDYSYTKDAKGDYIAPDFMRDFYDDYYLAFCIEMAEGLPPKLLSELQKSNDPGNVAKVVELHEGDNHVTYNQYFKVFKVIEVSSVRKRYILGYHTQDDSYMPWTFVYDIAINFFSSSYSDLKALNGDIAARVKKMSNVDDPDELFEISKLALNLKTLSTVKLPEIKISTAANALVEGEIKEYLNALEKAGVTIFGYAIKGRKDTEKNISNYIFIPKHYTFTVSGGDVKTLNYIIMFDETAFPEIRNFSWKWLESGEAAKISGVMAINRDKFWWKFLEQFREKILLNLRYNATALAEGGTYSGKIGIGVTYDDSNDTQLFKRGNDGTYEYGYSRYGETGKELIWDPPVPFPVASVQVYHRYTFNCKVSATCMEKNGKRLPAMLFNTRVSGYANFKYDDESNYGDYFDQSLICLLGFEIKPESHGEIAIIKDAHIQDNHPSGINYGIWSKIDTFGQIENSVEKVTGKLSSYLKNCVNYIEKLCENDCLFAHWVMPGCKTFSFSDQSFSDTGDFCSNVTYVQK
jgi:hypothetical protein